MNTQTNQPDRTTYLGGAQSSRVAMLNEGLVRQLYCVESMTIVEVAEVIGCQPVTVRKFMVKHEIPRRVAAKRDQSGNKNVIWAGDSVGYKSAHQRVYRARGRPLYCEHCKTTDSSKRYEWANLTGNYPDVNDYARLCRSCHCKFDGLIKNLGEYANVPAVN